MKVANQLFSRLLVIAPMVFLLCLFLAIDAKTEEAPRAPDSAAHGHEEKKEGEAPTPSGVGEGKAIIQATANNGMRLSEDALKAMTIQTASVSVTSADTVKIPPKSVLYFQADTGVYRLRDGWFKLVEGKVLSRNPTEVVFQSKDLRTGDQIVTNGAPLLRLGDLNIWSGGGDAD